MGNWLRRRKIGVQLQAVTALTLIALVALLIGIQLMESRRMHDARVSLLQSIDKSGSGIAGASYSADDRASDA